MVQLKNHNLSQTIPWQEFHQIQATHPDRSDVYSGEVPIQFLSILIENYEAMSIVMSTENDQQDTQKTIQEMLRSLAAPSNEGPADLVPFSVLLFFWGWYNNR